MSKLKKEYKCEEEPELRSFCKVWIVVNCICSSTETFVAWSSTSINYIYIYMKQNKKITNRLSDRWRIRHKAIAISNRDRKYAPFIWERNVFMYCKYSSIFLTQRARSRLIFWRESSGVDQGSVFVWVGLGYYLYL